MDCLTQYTEGIGFFYLPTKEGTPFFTMTFFSSSLKASKLAEVAYNFKAAGKSYMLSSSSRHTKSCWWNQSWPKPLWTETESSPEWMIIKSTRKKNLSHYGDVSDSKAWKPLVFSCAILLHLTRFFFFHVSLKDEDGMWSLLWGTILFAALSQPSFIRPDRVVTLHHILAHHMQNTQLNSCINSDSTVRSKHVYPGGKLRL